MTNFVANVNYMSCVLFCAVHKAEDMSAEYRGCVADAGGKHAFLNFKVRPSKRLLGNHWGSERCHLRTVCTGGEKIGFYSIHLTIPFIMCQS